MKNRWISYLALTVLIFYQCWSTAFAAPPTPVKTQLKNNTLIITNTSDQAFNLRHANIQFSYFGKVFKITNENDADQVIDFAPAESNSDKGKIYKVKIHGTKNIMLLPKQSLRLALATDKKDSPHNFSVKAAPEPVNVKVTFVNANWVETIYICNTTNAPIPLTNLEFRFNYSVPMPTNIWGSPWAAWKVASQVGGQVVLTGGTQFTPPLASDPNCMNPLTIQFNAPPTNPEPTGPFVFKAEGGGPPPQTGNLNVMLGAAPATGLPNPTLTVSGASPTQTKAVAWGTTWALTGLATGAYTVSGAAITAAGQTYTADPQNATVTANATANATITYKLSSTGTTAVTVNLVNPPSATVPITLTNGSTVINQNVSNGTVINLASGSYNVSSNVSGYTATPTPNPLVVPTNKTLSISYTAVVVGGAGTRTVTFVNQCPYPVWFGIISGATKSKLGDPETCNVDADCYPGSVCVDRGAAPKHCFWKNPIPTNGNFQLTANGGTNSVTFPYVQTPMNAVFSGAAAGRTNCTGAGCETADCGGGAGGCPPGRGFGQPTTQIEFTFQTNAVDFYNLSAVDGMNIPASMAPDAPFDTQKPYDCGTPGNPNPTPLFGACTWEFTPPSVEYRWVRAGGNACTSNADCTGGTVCGLSKAAGALKKTCGKQIGWFNANRICAEQANYGAPFNCQEQLPPPNQAYKMTNMLGCAPIPSCYQGGATAGCCGCADWDKLGIPVPPAPYTEQCKAKNPFWISRIQPGLEWIKRGCPSIYTYAFDDMSSTFTCRVNKTGDGGAQINSVNYTMTFCPGGKTGGVTPIA